MTSQLDIMLVASVTAAACAILGVFLVLRRSAMLSDAISHAILPGLVIGFFITESLHSPLLLVGAALTGVLTVALIEAISQTQRVKQDAAIGLVFPILFSIGVIMISRYAGDVHMDQDAVLLGALEFVWLDRLVVAGQDLGPKALWTMGGVLLVLNTAFVTVFFKELKLSTFDKGLAATLGFAPTVLSYVLMSLVSVTAVSAFDAVGSILVVALMIGPAATAYLLTDRLPVLLGLSVALGVASALGGYGMARVFDVNIAGSAATVVGLLFTLVVPRSRPSGAFWPRYAGAPGSAAPLPRRCSSSTCFTTRARRPRRASAAPSTSRSTFAGRPRWQSAPCPPRSATGTWSSVKTASG